MKFGFVNNFRFRVALVILFVSMVPLGIVSWFSVRTAEEVITSIVTNQLENMAAEKQDLLERWITERKADVAVVAGSSVVRSMDPAQLGPYLRLVQERYGVYRRFVVVGLDGGTVFDTGARSDRSPLEESWYSRLETEPAYMSEVRRDPRGEGSVF